ncbi:MAG TPA: hypothetical protein VIW72_07200 [Burkholderiales bacterium]
MNRAILRIFFLVPAAFLALDAISVFGSHPDWPQPALDYLAWYRSTPLMGAAFIANRIAMVGFVGLLVSSIALVVFWSPARYLYAASLVLILVGDYIDLPMLAGGWETILDDLAKLFAGANAVLMFSSIRAPYFTRANSRT